MSERSPSPNGKQQQLRRQSSKYQSGLTKLKRAAKTAAVEKEVQQAQERGLTRTRSGVALDNDLRGSMHRLTGGAVMMPSQDQEGELHSGGGGASPGISSKRKVNMMLSNVQTLAKDKMMQQVLLGQSGAEDDLLFSEEEEMFLQEINLAAVQSLETKRRSDLAHRAMMRPRLWFCNRILPITRFFDLQQQAHLKRAEYIQASEPVYRDLILLDEDYSRLVFEVEKEEGSCRDAVHEGFNNAVRLAHDELYFTIFSEGCHDLYESAQLELDAVAKAAMAVASLMLEEESTRVEHLVDPQHKAFHEELKNRFEWGRLELQEVERRAEILNVEKPADEEKINETMFWRKQHILRREALERDVDITDEAFSRKRKSIVVVAQRASSVVSLNNKNDDDDGCGDSDPTPVANSNDSKEENAHQKNENSTSNNSAPAAAPSSTSSAATTMFMKLLPAQMAGDVDTLMEAVGEEALADDDNLLLHMCTGGGNSMMEDTISGLDEVYCAFASHVYNVTPKNSIVKALQNVVDCEKEKKEEGATAATKERCLDFTLVSIGEKHWHPLLHALAAMLSVETPPPATTTTTRILLPSCDLHDEHIAALCRVLRPWIISSSTVARCCGRKSSSSPLLVLDLSHNYLIGAAGLKSLIQLFGGVPSCPTAGNSTIDETVNSTSGSSSKPIQLVMDGVRMLPSQRKKLSAVL